MGAGGGGPGGATWVGAGCGAIGAAPAAPSAAARSRPAPGEAAGSAARRPAAPAAGAWPARGRRHRLRRARRRRLLALQRGPQQLGRVTGRRHRLARRHRLGARRRRRGGRRRGGRRRLAEALVHAAGRAVLDAHDEVADVDLVGLLHDERARDLAAVDVRAVGALQVDDDELAVLEHDARVALRHVALGQDDVVPLHPPDGDLRFVEHDAALLAALLGDQDREH